MIIVELENCTEILLTEIDYKYVTRISLSRTYALAIMHGGSSTDWEKVNQAIIKRWSRSGLEYIKKKAWKIVDGMRKEQ